MKKITEVELAMWFEEWQKKVTIDEIIGVYENVNGVTLEERKINSEGLYTFDVIEI